MPTFPDRAQFGLQEAIIINVISSREIQDDSTEEIIAPTGVLRLGRRGDLAQGDRTTVANCR